MHAPILPPSWMNSRLALGSNLIAQGCNFLVTYFYSAMPSPSSKKQQRSRLHSIARSCRRKGPLDDLNDFVKSAKQQEARLRQDLRKGL